MTRSDKLINSRNITFYLKGFAIVSVLINHYINNYLSKAFIGYANGIIALFFILSGYGIFYSLSKYDKINTQAIFQYFYKRLVRIYPLYWISLLLIIFATHKLFQFKTILAIPLFQAPDIYWFITSLIQCYLIAPFLFLFIKKFGSTKYLSLIFFLMIFDYIVYLYIGIPYSRELFVYRYLFLGHIFLFALGMSMPLIIAKHQSQLNDKLFVLFFFFFFVILVYYTRKENMLFNNSAIHLAPLFITVIFIFCLYAIATNPPLFLKGPVIAMGTYSYSLYLFHPVFYKSLAKLGIIKHGSLQSIILTLFLFPTFLLACLISETLINKVLLKLQTI